MRVLFVCLGNICRSPAAEGVMRQLAPEMTLDSAGTDGWHVGDPPYGPMQAAARLRGIDLSGLRARQFKACDFDAFDLIVAMDRQNQKDIEALRPSGHPTSVRTLGTSDVPDPYYTDDFEDSLDIIEAGCVSLRADIDALLPR